MDCTANHSAIAAAVNVQRNLCNFDWTTQASKSRAFAKLTSAITGSQPQVRTFGLFGVNSNSLGNT